MIEKHGGISIHLCFWKIEVNFQVSSKIGKFSEEIKLSKKNKKKHNNKKKIYIHNFW